VGRHGLDGWDCALGLIIASFKGSLVVLIFMHMNHEKRVVYLLAALAAVHASGLAVLLFLSEVDRVRDPLFYHRARQADTRGTVPPPDAAPGAIKSSSLSR